MYLDSLLHHEAGKAGRLLISKATVAATQQTDQAYRVLLRDSTPQI